MRKWLILLVFLLATGITGWYVVKKSGSAVKSKKDKPLYQFSHSANFNAKAEAALNAYLAMKDAFVEYDSNTVIKHAALFIQLIDSIPLDELKKDSGAIYQTALITREDIKSNITSLIQQPNLTEMRKDFSTATEMIYPGFLKLIKYEGGLLYIQRCPMAFDDSIPANWLSNSNEKINPYLGKFHNKYKSGMLHCAEIIDSIGIE